MGHVIASRAGQIYKIVTNAADWDGHWIEEQIAACAPAGLILKSLE
jgi:hypothetical protein